MSYGFVIRSGTGAIVESVSSDTPPGVLLDTFLYPYSQTRAPMTRSYPTFPGTQLLPIVQSTSALGSTVVITVNNATRTLTISGVDAAFDYETRNDVLITVLGV